MEDQGAGEFRPLEKNRLVVIHTVYFQAHGFQPLQPVEARYERLLDTPEQHYGPRQMVIGEEWEPIDQGWFKDAPVGSLVLHNLEGKFLQRVPTEAEKRDMESRVLEIAVIHPSEMGKQGMWDPPRQGPLSFASVRPGEDCRFEPTHLPCLLLRCRKGKAKCTLTLFPT